MNHKQKEMHEEKYTYRPSIWMIVLRYVFEGFGFLLLVAFKAISFAYLCISLIYLYWITCSQENSVDNEDGVYKKGEKVILSFYASQFWHWRVSFFFVLIPFSILLFLILNLSFTILVKWIVIGRFSPGEYPLWSFYVWRTELVERIEENIALPSLIFLSGTRFISSFYYWMGSKVGNRCYLEHPIICEADLIRIGDYSTIGRGATIQSHLFQDRVRFLNHLHLMKKSTVCSNSIVLPGSKIHDNCILAPFSLCMRNEELPRNSKWQGLPCESVI